MKLNRERATTATVLQRMRRDFLLKLDAKGRADFIEWSLPWLPVDKEIKVEDDDYRVRIIMEPKRPLGRPRGTTAIPFAEFLEERAKVDEKFFELNKRLPTHSQRAQRMGGNYWDGDRPTTTYRNYEERRKQTES